MIKKFIPQTIAAQLISLLLIVLIIGQGASLWLLIGENRMQARAVKFRALFEDAVMRTPDANEIAQMQLPYELPSRQAPGAFFVSRNNRASLMASTQHLPKYERLYENMLRTAGHEPLTVLVMLQSGKRGLKAGVTPPGRHNRPAQRPPPAPPPRRQERHVQQQSPAQGEQKPRFREENPYRLFHPRRPRERANTPAVGMQDLFLSVEITPGIWYNAMIPHYSLQSISARILTATGIWIILTLLAVWFFARRITRPLSALTLAANRLGRGETTPPLSEEGPSDLQIAARAFNTMQTRLTRTLETQRAMLRAIGHDLRTPLTSLRIRAENITEPALQKKFVATIDDMTVMTEEILDWAKDVSGLEKNAAVDLSALLAAQADNYSDQGHPVTFEDCVPIIFNFRRIALTRAVQNLIDNALKYGKSAHISLEQFKDKTCIHIDDEGPGIPEDKLQDVCKPFVRLELSRSKGTGGIGLGLSITDSIVQSAGGQLILTNRTPKGLRATIQLPGEAANI